MMLVEETTVPALALPVQALKDHLRLGSGFADSGMQDGLIESYLRAAIAAIEGRTAKMLITRRFRWDLEDWRNTAEQALPVAPVSLLVSVTLVSASGVPTVLAPASYRLIADLHRPKLASVGTLLPTVPTGGKVEIRFDAGFGLTWGAVPADLQQAVLLLAAEYYEHRHDGAHQGAGLPFGVVVLIERWRTVRVLGGGGA